MKILLNNYSFFVFFCVLLNNPNTFFNLILSCKLWAKYGSDCKKKLINSHKHVPGSNFYEISCGYCIENFYLFNYKFLPNRTIPSNIKQLIKNCYVPIPINKNGFQWIKMDNENIEIHQHGPACIPMRYLGIIIY